METPETIRVSLHKGEWVTSLDFSDAYFHIPIHPRSRKYLRFFLNSKAYQFTALPFGLATAPLEFTKVVKEGKLMAQTRGIRIHQYLDDWLLRAPCPEICQQHTQTHLALCRELGWVVNMKKSELVPQQIFNFVGYRFDLHCRALGDIKDETPLYQGQGLLHGQAVHVTHRALNSHREASVVRSPPHEAHSMAPQEALACAGGPREGDPGRPCSPSSPGLVVGRK